MQDTNEPDPETLVAIAWQEAGMRAPIPTSPLAPSACDIRGCGAESWVQIKTKYGPAGVCFKHFQSIRSIAGG